ncbi:hypothetical protein ABH930_002822 [Kitasatospora sp. GAS204A]|nr:hypothetical protein [Kitasatospora sp. GAS204B]
MAETLRYYPSAWFFSRTVTAPVELAGSRLRQGSAVLLSPYLIHHRPDLYPEPELFDVDRWLPERRAALARGAYIPFGAGSRKCIGDVYALTEPRLGPQLTPLPGSRHPPPDRQPGTAHLAVRAGSVADAHRHRAGRRPSVIVRMVYP